MAESHLSQGMLYLGKGKAGTAPHKMVKLQSSFPHFTRLPQPQDKKSGLFTDLQGLCLHFPMLPSWTSIARHLPLFDINWQSVSWPAHLVFHSRSSRSQALEGSLKRKERKRYPDGSMCRQETANKQGGSRWVLSCPLSHRSELARRNQYGMGTFSQDSLME